MHYTDIVAHQIIFLVIFMAFLNAVTRKEIRSITSKFFTAMLGCDLVMLLALILELKFADLSVSAGEKFILPMQICACFDFISYFTLICLFTYYILDFISYKTKVSWIYGHMCVGVGVLFTVGWCASIFNGMFFTVENGLFTHGPHYWFAMMGGIFVTIVSLFLIIRYFKDIGTHDALFLLSFLLLPVFSIYIRLHASFVTMQMALTVSILLMFNFIHLHQVRYILKQQAKLREDKIALSFSQIRPHFIFNTLNSIYVLCDKDPAAVKNAIGDFASYLRINLDVLENQDEIPFKTAVENLNHYIRLEQLRFRDDVFVTYDLQETDFMIPPMTLQPLVENAIKHGILKKKNGGTVAISSCKNGDFYKVKIADDGVGFDVSTLEEEESNNQHIGIKNVKDRLWIMCRGQLEVRSERGKGTSVIISIPETERGKKNEYCSFR